MPAFSVSRSIVIEAPVEKVYSILRDFRQWPQWSPWLIAEPGCTLEYTGDGKGYAWVGNIVGSGEIHVTDETPPRRMQCDLNFLKPWRSHADVRFDLSEKDGGTEVMWLMDSKLPFLLFFMKKMMIAMIGNDYERGLAMFKDYFETGDSKSELSFGSASFDAFHYVGKTSTCSTEEIGPTMAADLKRLGEWVTTEGIEPAGAPLSIYHKWDMVTGVASYTSAIPVASIPETLPDDLQSGGMPSISTYAITHTGPYRHLGNAWSSGIMHGRAKMFDQRRGIHPFEIYENDPQEVPEDELKTVVHFPVK